ncbi:hypothetical protein SLEP1_g55620 [Rubroshorea leprosula]|uniref:LAGLIDADG homing endonuclease n=1 Tax=Rubroshorea leprosula TaxID=152421 RepID=A0AAV5MGW3_9ROSI|nr:hypothetical protein SLEP1_g55620 [Rubroshorea leprosula]
MSTSIPQGHGNYYSSENQKVQASSLYILTRKASPRGGGEEMSPVTKATKAKAEVCYGGKTCSEKFALLLAEMGVLGWLLTVLDILECGYVKDREFVVWLRHKKNREYYKFEDTVINCAVVITAYFQPNKIKNLTGVKTREFLIWINLTEICGEEGDDSLACLSKSFPLSLFGGIRAQTLVFTFQRGS